jgi:chorismate mutase
MHKPSDDHDAVSAELVRLRAEIEAIDGDLIRLLAQRVRLARRAGAVKQATGLPAFDPVREAAVLRRAGELARAVGVTDEDVAVFFQHIIGMSRRAQLDEP